MNSRFEINGRGIIVPHNLSEGRNDVELLSPPEEILWLDECANMFATSLLVCY